ncbi:heavy metal translocating P-type ATPase [Candidatus Methylobacter oryzae]|uniref:P-type Zn(2+) transporter n=1 Tax=Candidatus Methylobacter oryzae TaxID=2497749 RepID=A0ABY3C6A5_9GAMM|nr:heavy metal translocating P-type ATPase [Candidatus Methylobacter oryzae]TRW90810.1 heavy metal translocating P-type ATPase [Candidatus Methylobacter oryzae]
MIDLAIVFLSYSGTRLYEKYKKSKAPQEIQKAAKDLSIFPAADETGLTQKEQQQRNNIMSGVTLGAATLRVLNPTPLFALLDIASYTYTMFPFYRQVEFAVKERLIKDRRVDSYLLMGIGNLLLLGTGRYFIAALGLSLAYISESIITKATDTAQQNLHANLFGQLFDPNQKVWVIQDGVELEVTLENVQQGDILVVKAGEAIPVDGVVVDGMASVDQHAFTGESYPVEKGVGEAVFASTLMLTGKLQVKVEKSGRDTAIGKLSDILGQAFENKTEIQLRGEQWAEAANLPFLVLAGVGLVFSGPTGAMVILGGNTVQAIRLLGPLATINYQSVASSENILIKQGQRIEQISSIDTLLFDKTGTLTDGALNVSAIHVVHADYLETDVLFYAALAEHQLTHPIAKAIMQHAELAGLDVDNLDDIEYRQGFGIVVQFDQRTIHVGSARFMTVEGIALSDSVAALQNRIHELGHSLVMVAVDSEVAGVIELQATLRPEVQAVFKKLKEHGIKHIGIVSGDHAAPTQKLAEQLNVDSFFAEVLPEDKAGIVKQFQAEGRTVCFIGDGVNDTIAMRQADLSISLRGATTLAIDVADIILTNPDLNRLCELMALSDKLENNLKRGLGICYTGMGVVLAGSFLVNMDILTATLVHFVLGTGAVGNAMLPLLEINKENAGNAPENLDAASQPSATAAGPADPALGVPVELSPVPAKAQQYQSAA